VKVGVYGAGAIGGLLGAKLAKAGVDVTLIARGPHLEAIQAKGLTLSSGDESFTVTPRAYADPRDAEQQDCVIIALKSNAVPAISARLAPMLGPATPVVLAVNGMPWWYFYRASGPYAERRIEAVDPGGMQWTNIRPERAIGCVVYPAAEIVAPGHVRHIDGDRFSLGEPSGEKSARIRAISGALKQAELKAPIKTDIRQEIWVKLWGNAVFNPISALTGATLRTICNDPETGKFAKAAMQEVEAVAESVGVTMPISLSQRFSGAEAVGEHKTSMLQDLENGKTLELDALVGSVIEIATWTGVSVPFLESLYALTKLRAEQRQM
jgi:2-dehydropantoate 2-reductase